MYIEYLKERLFCRYPRTKRCVYIQIGILALALSISVIALILFDIIVASVITLILVGIVSGIIICLLVQNKKLRTWLSERGNSLLENSVGVTITGLIISVFLLGFFYFHPPSQIIVEPQKFEVIIPAGDSIIRSISIKNIDGSEKNISVCLPKLIENWIIIANKDFTINAGQTKNINFSINIPLQTSLGDYREAIKIIYENDTIAEIPILLTVQPQAQFQATIDAPGKVNIIDYFKVKINIKNIGDSPVHGIEIKLNKSSTTGLNILEFEEKKNIGLLSKNVEFSTEWWIIANKIGWQTIQFDINSNNAGNQTMITKIKVEG